MAKLIWAFPRSEGCGGAALKEFVVRYRDAVRRTPAQVAFCCLGWPLLQTTIRFYCAEKGNSLATGDATSGGCPRPLAAMWPSWSWHREKSATQGKDPSL